LTVGSVLLAVRIGVREFKMDEPGSYCSGRIFEWAILADQYLKPEIYEAI
jgi:hypothetical protein